MSVMATTMTMAPVGPVAAAFRDDLRLLTAIMGPFGSAKTVTCIQKCIKIALMQPRGPDGIRRARIAVVRDTYPQLEKNVLKSWHMWFPKDRGRWNGRAPMEHVVGLSFLSLDGGPTEHVELEMIFIALGDNKAEDVMKGLELTALWLNETDTLDRGVLSYGIGRIGRYPPQNLGGCAWRGVFGDFNAPDIDNWTYEVFVDANMGLEPEQEASLREEFGPLYGIGFHRQPGGRTPNAENLANLVPGYYAQIMVGQTANWIKRYVENEFGPVRNGQPVYPEFNDNFHIAREDFAPLPGVLVSIGVDGGTTPAAILGQRTSTGQIRVFDEIVVFQDNEEKGLERIGAEKFGEAVRDHIFDRYPDAEIGTAWCDPATAAEEDRSWMKFFSKGLGIKARAAPLPSNATEPRLAAVRKPLMSIVDGGEPQLLLSPRCRYLRRGFNSGYVLGRVSLSNGGGRWTDKPLKNDFSHSQDALQYLCVGFGKGRDLPRDERERKRVVTEYAIHGGMR